MPQSPEEARVGVVPQQGAVPPVLQGGLVGHMPDAQVPSLNVVKKFPENLVVSRNFRNFVPKY